MKLTHFIVKSICSYLIFLAGITLIVFAGTQTTVVATKIVLGGYAVTPTYSYSYYPTPSSPNTIPADATPEDKISIQEYNASLKTSYDKGVQDSDYNTMITRQYDASQQRTGGYPDLARSLTLLILGVAVLLLGRKLTDELKNA